MKYEVYYVLDVYEYDWVGGTRSVEPFSSMNLANGVWELTESTYNAEHVEGLMRDVFNRYAPYGNVIVDQSPAYVIEDLIENEDGTFVMVEYDMCLSVSIVSEEDGDVGAVDLTALGFQFN